MSNRYVAFGLATTLALSLAACAPPAPPRRATAETTSATMDRPAKKDAAASMNVDALLERESTTPLQDFRVRAADGALELHVKAVASPTVKTHRREGGSAYTIATFSIGSDTEVVCNASSSPLDIAHWAEDIVKSIHVQLATAPSVRVEAPESRPLMFIDTDGAYKDEKDGLTKRNIAKFAGVHFDGGSVTCVHDGVGYRKTFHDVMSHIAVKTQSPNAPRPTFRQVTTIHEGDKTLGFSYRQRWEGAKKGEWHEGELGSVILHDDHSWAAGDSGWHGVVDAKGVVSERAMKRVGAITWVDMTLERKTPTTYAFDGTVHGVAKRGTFTTRSPLVTSLSRTPLLLGLMKDPKKAEVTFFHFDESDPEKGAIKETARRAGPTTVRLEENGKIYDATIDARGVLVRFQGDGGPHTWRELASEGSP
ncbi:MAG: hypothetical protein JST00_15675 [Deltaproteobacteria bacterium]|nr:hypothetical protein [Deltaproteobacteria bacterium]